MKKHSNIKIFFFSGMWSLVAFTIIFTQFFCIAVNTTESIPYKYLLIWKSHIEAKTGDYMAFYAPQNGRYPHNKAFIKRVLGISGDLVEEKSNHFFINGNPIGPWFKEDSKKRPLHAGPTGIIPEKYYFMAGTHKESFDSRYKEIGWIHEKDIIGRAYPIF